MLTQLNPRTPDGLRDRANKTLRVRKGKGGRARLLPLGATLARVLESYRDWGRHCQASCGCS